MFDLKNIVEKIIDMLILYTPKLIGTILILAIGFGLVKVILKIIDRFLDKSKVDLSLHSFVKSISEVILKIMVVLTAAGMLGIPMGSFIVVLSTAGLAIGLAVKDSLSNLAGGFLILTFRPFNVGDYIEAQGKIGTVREIKILYTHLITPDNKRIIIPNGDLANTEITNCSVENERRVDLIFGIGYEDDIDHARRVLNNVLENHNTVLKEPAPVIKVESLGDNAVNIIVKAWTKTENYLDTHYDLQELIKKRFDKEGIEMPFPQKDIHLYNEQSFSEN